MKLPRHWQDPANGCVAVLILVSPWVAGYAMVQPAVANAVIVGTFLFTVSVAAAVIGRPWVECAGVAVGAWFMTSPWALSLADERARRSAVVLGGLALLLGAGALAADMRGRTRMRGQTGQHS
jgi:hypothetical protein